MQGEAPAAAAPAAGGRARCRSRPSSRGASERPFVGRERELAVLRRRWAGTPSGEGGVVVLAGEAGMGKTRLGGPLRRRGARRRRRPSCTGASTRRRWCPTSRSWRRCATTPRTRATTAPRSTSRRSRRWCPSSARPAPRPSAPAGERENRRYRLFEAVAALLGQAAGERPLLLVVEDLQWAGRPTLLLLRHVVRRLHGAPLLVLVTLRDAEADPGGAPARLLADLSREHVVERVALAGLTEAETAELVGDAELARSLQGRTAGNPFFIEEMLRSLAEAPEEPPRRPRGRQGPRLAPAGAAGARDGRGADRRRRPRPRLRPRPARGDGRAAGGGRCSARSRRRMRAGLVREDAEHADRFAFAHALVRETLYDAPAHARRARLHLRAGQALEAAGAPPGELAHHFFAAREVGGAEAAVAHGAEAARQAVAAHAYEEAAWHLEQALAALALARPEDGSARAELLLALGDVRWQASEPGARTAFEEAAELARRRRRARGPRARGARGRRALLHADGARRRLRRPARGGRRRPRRGRRAAARAAARPARRAPRARRRGRARRPQLGAEAVAMARRGGDEGALAAALMGRHAALLGIEHVDGAPAGDRRGGRDRRAARGARARRARAALAHLRPRRARRDRRGQARARPPRGARARAAPAAVLARRARLARRLGRSWPGASRRPSASRASRCGSPRRPARPRRARSSSRSCSPSGASRAGSASWPSRSSGSRARPGRSASSWSATLPFVARRGRRARARAGGLRRASPPTTSAARPGACSGSPGS